MEVKASPTVIENLKHDNNIMKRKIERIGLKQLIDEMMTYGRKITKIKKNNKKRNTIKHLQHENNDMQKKCETFKFKSSDELQKLIRESEFIQKRNKEKEESLMDI